MAIPSTRPGAIAVVTGSSSGIGLELARLLAARGHDLMLVARRRERLDALAEDLQSCFGIKVEVRACDLGDQEQRHTFAGELSLREVSVLCNNAGFATIGNVAVTDPATQLLEIEVNVKAVAELTYAVLPQMIARHSGAILMVGSTAGMQPFPGSATYSASKAFVNTLSEALHTELRGTGVTCTLLAPGPVATEFNAVAGITATEQKAAIVSISAVQTAQAALDGVARGRRLVVPGALAKVAAVSGRYTPHALLLPVLHRFSNSLHDRH